MSAELLFCSGDNAPAFSEEEVRDILADALEMIPDEGTYLGRKHLSFGRLGISVSLVTETTGEPIAASAIVSDWTEIKHVSRLCKAFSAMGWEF